MIVWCSEEAGQSAEKVGIARERQRFAEEARLSALERLSEFASQNAELRASLVRYQTVTSVELLSAVFKLVYARVLSEVGI